MGSSPSKESSKIAKTKVVIIGGSYAGRAAVYLLDPSFDVTWIERRPGLIHKMMVRSMVREDWIEPALVFSSDKLLRRGKLIRGNVTAIDAKAKEVEYESIEGKQKVDYDFLVIASGATSHCPIEPRFSDIKNCTKESITKFYQSVAATISKHNNIMIVGGGPVGCEVAAEIKAKYPSKTVSIANKTSTLCSGMRMTHDGSKKIQKALEKHKIKVFLNASISLSESERNQGLIEYDTPKNVAESIKEEVTLLINCTGSTPNTEFVSSDLKTPEALIKVNKYLQASESIFAIGDCNNVDEPKLFVTSGTRKFMFGLPVGQADILAKNLIAIVQGKDLTQYKPKGPTAKPQVLLPLGPKDAVAVNAPGFFAKMKAKDYFYPGQWKFSGLQPPRRPQVL